MVEKRLAESAGYEAIRGMGEDGLAREVGSTLSLKDRRARAGPVRSARWREASVWGVPCRGSCRALQAG